MGSKTFHVGQSSGRNVVDNGPTRKVRGWRPFLEKGEIVGLKNDNVGLFIAQNKTYQQQQEDTHKLLEEHGYYE
jgi:hypothetical protein